MAKLGMNIDTTNASSEITFGGALPEGIYRMVIVGEETRPTSNKTGERLSLEFQVIEGPLKDRKYYHGLNMVNPNPKAVEIAMKELASIGKAAGLPNFDDTTMLFNRPLDVSLGVKLYKGKWQNEARAFYTVGQKPFDPNVVGQLPPVPESAQAPSATPSYAPPTAAPPTAAPPTAAPASVVPPAPNGWTAPGA